MPFDWREFLALARNLTGFSNLKEAASRTAVSRAYYAAFCRTRNYAESRLAFQPTRTGQDHGLLRKHLRRLGSHWIKIAEDLNELYLWRCKCDYDDIITHNLQIMALNAIDVAENIINYCK